MSRHLPQVDFFSGCVKPVNHYDNDLDKALSKFVIGVLDLVDGRLVVSVDCSYGNIALFLYVNNDEVDERSGY